MHFYFTTGLKAYLVHIGTYACLCSIKSSIPSLLGIDGSKYYLPPPVIYPQLITADRTGGNNNKPEYVIFIIPIWRKCSREGGNAIAILSFYFSGVCRCALI